MSLWIKICGNTSLADAQLAAEAGARTPADRSSSAGRGADAVGFVFAPSPRRVTPAQVAAIVPHLPASLEKIGVFVDASLDEIASTVEACSLTGVQLHWDAPPDLPARLRARFGPSLRILRVVHFAANRSEYVSVSGDSVSGRDGAPSEPRAMEASQKPGASEAAEKLGVLKGHDFSRADGAVKMEGALAPQVRDDPNVDAILVDSRTPAAIGGTGQTYDWDAARRSLFGRSEQLKLIAAGGLTPENVAEAIATLRPWGVDVVSGVESVPGRKDPAKVRAFIANARAAGASQT
jgi:phosphoribosylanthranilate isomerase